MFAEETKKYQLSSTDFSEVVTIDLEKEIRFVKKDLSSKALKYFMRMSSFLNRKYYENQAKRLSVYGIPRVISLYKNDDEYLYLPRGCFEQVIEVLNNLKIKYIINDRRINGEKINTDFNGILKEEQEVGLNHLLKKDNGIFVAPTGFGKTVVAANLISKLKVNTLILVNNKNLCEQWDERLNSFLNLNYETNKKYKVGIIHGSTKKITNKIDIALIQSLASNEELRNTLNNYGLIIFDEAHHLAAVSYENVLRSFSAKYIYGFTATPKRSDGYEKINYMVIGPCIFNYEVDDKSSYKKILSPHFTKFKLQQQDKNLSLTDIEEKLINNDERNCQIINDIKNSINTNKKILVLTNRVEHAKMLFNEIKKFINNVFLIYGNISKKDKEEFIDNFNKIKDEQFVIISTGKYIGEGFDEKRLDTLFLTMPFKWRGTLQQYVGRLHRDNETKFQVEVHDYIDLNVPMLFKMYSERQKGYKELKYISIDENNKLEVLFDDNNYFNNLIEDLENAESIKFYIQYANSDKLKLLLEKCKVIPIIYSNDMLENIDSYSIENIKFNIIIINDSILWYGGINPFIFKKDDLTIARLDDKEICNNIIVNVENKVL
ncbi:MAG: DEAD/DEAH box helicase [Bacilli bacterium]|nr:DEAD/DEAH box helicase [Bacilli bacterium]